MSRNLRHEMPQTAAWIDSLREAFGTDLINTEIKKGMQGIPGFWAEENGHQIGTKDTRHGTEISAAHLCIGSNASQRTKQA